MAAKLLCGILFLLLITNLLLTAHIYCKYTRSYKDDLTYEEKIMIRRCLETERNRALLVSREEKAAEYLLAKWEIVSGLADEE